MYFPSLHLPCLLCRIAALLIAVILPIAAAHAAEVPEDIADMKVQDLRAGGDEQKRYFVIQRPGEIPANGWRVLFVLPGGPGNAEFQPFVTRLAKNAVPAGTLVVQLVAPVWNAKQAQEVVWPLKKDAAPGIRFTTPEFFLAVRDEVAKAHKLDPKFVFTLTWSSSGPAGYTLSLIPEARITGSFVAMSVFKPTTLPALGAAKGRSYFLYHSPSDFIPLSFAESARDALKRAGATVELQQYEGGHGWHGDIFGDIRKGLDWLGQQAEKAPAK